MKRASGSRLVWFVLIPAGVIAVALGLLLPSEEHGPSFWWSHIWAVFAMIGLVGCVVLIVIAKLLGRYWLQRKDKYYD